MGKQKEHKNNLSTGGESLGINRSSVSIRIDFRLNLYKVKRIILYEGLQKKIIFL